MRTTLQLLLLLLPLPASLTACDAAAGNSGAPDAGPPPRELQLDTSVDATGFSAEVSFDVPAGTRSLTVVARGQSGALYALGSFTTSDGVEHVGLDLQTPPGAAMQAAYFDEQAGQMPGHLYQSLRLGTFSLVYPYRPDQALPAGHTSVRIASDMPGAVTLTLLMPPDDGSSRLRLNLIAVSDQFSYTVTPSFADELQAIFTQAGIQVEIASAIQLTGTGLESLTDFTEPQETPTSMAAALAGLADDQVAADALDVFVVEGLPSGVGGLSLGTPGPPIRGSYYYGVVVLHFADDANMARVIAHEVAHFLALQHVSNTGVSGAIYPDPLDDTYSGQGNLMEDGTTLTADQASALSRSRLLVP